MRLNIRTRQESLSEGTNFTRLSLTTLESVFPPNPIGRLRYEFAEGLAKRGNRITVITSLPSIRNKLDKSGTGAKFPPPFYLEETEDFSIIRVVPKNGDQNNLLGNIMAHLVTPFSLTIVSYLKSADSQIIHCSSPPLFLAMGACIVSSIRRKPLVLRIHDLHPDALIKMGLLKNRLLIGILRAIEKFVYVRASIITVLSPSYKSYVTSVGVPESKVQIIPNWYQTETPTHLVSRPLDEVTGVSMHGKTVFTYAGSLYWAQDLDIVIESAKLLSERRDILFLIVGEGPKKKGLVEKAEKMRLENIRFLPMQRKPEYLQIVNESRACIVSLADGYTSPTFPSKIPELMGLGKPILMKAPSNSEVAKLTKEAGCGLFTDSRDPEAFVKLVLELTNNKDFADRLGRNGKDYARKFFSPSSCIDKYEELLNRLPMR